MRVLTIDECRDLQAFFLYGPYQPCDYFAHLCQLLLDGSCTNSHDLNGYRYELLLDSALKVNDSEYIIGLSSLGALSEARVIMGSCLWCFCLFSRVDVGVEGMAERALALLRVLMPKIPPLAARMLLFFVLVTGIA
ncbi:hypothetical protein ACFXTH_013491 [Malus domestica]